MYEFINSNIQNAIASDMNVYNDESMKITQNKDLSLSNISKNIIQSESAGVSIDLYKFSRPAVLKLYDIIKDYIEVKKELNLWTEVAFPELFKNEKIFPFDIKGKHWVEVDNTDDLSLADILFSNFENPKNDLI